jgi:hypothetical protein
MKLFLTKNIIVIIQNKIMTDLERNRNTTTGLGKGNNAMENDSDQTPNVNFYQ